MNWVNNSNMTDGNSIAGSQERQPLLSDEMNEIISYQPHWFIRRGNVIFLVILLAMLGISWFIKYPDTINTSLRLTSVNAPKMLESRTNGKLEKILIKNGELVVSGQHLAYIESTGNYKEIMKLYNWTCKTSATVSNRDTSITHVDPLPALTTLGAVQQQYQDFALIMKETKETLSGGYYQRKISNVQQDLNYLSSMRSDAAKQQDLVSKDQEIQQKEFEAYEKLAAEKVIAPVELNQYKSKLLAKDQSLKQIHSQITSTEMNSLAKRKELLELQKAITDQRNQFIAALHLLKTKIEEWIQQYVIVSSESGRLEYVGFLQTNQLVEAGQSLFFIQQDQTGYYAEMKAGQAGFGKIKEGQKVIIKVAGFPDQEFGHIEGRVSYISSLPDGRDSFLIKVELPHGLRTNYNKEIRFQNSLSASGEVVTDNRRLSDRFFGRLKQAFK